MSRVWVHFWFRFHIFNIGRVITVHHSNLVDARFIEAIVDVRGEKKVPSVETFRSEGNPEISADMRTVRTEVVCESRLNQLTFRIQYLYQDR